MSNHELIQKQCAEILKTLDAMQAAVQRRHQVIQQGFAELVSALDKVAEHINRELEA